MFKREALAIMQGAASESDIAWFRDLSLMPAVFGGGFTWHVTARNCLVEMLNRMEKSAGGLNPIIGIVPSD